MPLSRVPLAFTYHHNDLTAYYPVAVAILDAGLTCSASLPCPAEMGASIHINGTGSSIMDTVFICRTIGTVPGKWVPDSPQDVADLCRRTSESRNGNVKATIGDTRCIAYGHLVRLAIWNLRKNWDKDAKDGKRIMAGRQMASGFRSGQKSRNILKARASGPCGPLMGQTKPRRIRRRICRHFLLKFPSKKY